MTNDELILAWQEAAKNAKSWTEREREMRSMIYGAFFGDLEDGTTHNHPLGNGFKLKGKRPLSYKLDSTTSDRLDELSKLGNEGSFIADRLVKWTPSLSLTEYDNLSDEQRAIIDPAITVTPGLPTIELVEPK